MFFDFIPNTLTTLTILFPLYATHKSLTSPTPPSPQQTTALYRPWLTYFLIYELFLLAESYTPIIPSLPFYSLARLGLHVYLLLPGPGQGASYLYSHYVRSFLCRHERMIEDGIKDAHDALKSVPGVEFALAHAAEIWAMLRERVFGQERRSRNIDEEVRRAPPTANTYVASLLGRFIAPEDSGSAQSSSATSMAGLLSSALGQASSLAAAAGARSVSGGSTSRGGPAEPLIPEHFSSDRERLGYITAQRDRLRTLLGAFDKEEETIHLAAGAGSAKAGMARSRSEYEFETIRQEDVGEGEGDGDGHGHGHGEGRPGAERRTSRGWFGMFGQGSAGGHEKDE